MFVRNGNGLRRFHSNNFDGLGMKMTYVVGLFADCRARIQLPPMQRAAPQQLIETTDHAEISTDCALK